MRKLVRCALVAAALAFVAGGARTGAAPQESILYAFFTKGSSDGAGPLNGVIADSTGNLFGTTVFGGTQSVGTFFELERQSDNTYQEHILYNFRDGLDGGKPGALTAANDGSFYTVTLEGGVANLGNVARFSPARSGYHEDVLYSFRGSTDGGEPLGPLVVDQAGAIYGVTQYAASGLNGKAFKLTRTRSGYAETDLHEFSGGSDGYLPQAGLAIDRAGAVFGTTYYGGDTNACGGAGCGVVFKLTPANGGFIYTVLHRFHAGADGSQPFSALTIDAATGIIYGTTQYGGNGCRGGCGTVFELQPTASPFNYNERVIYSFKGRLDGFDPEGTILVGKNRVLYGSASLGGKACSGIGCGETFALKPNGAVHRFVILHNFVSGSDGAEPEWAALIQDQSGAIYGTTRSGGGNHCSDGGPGGTLGCGVVYKITP